MIYHEGRWSDYPLGVINTVETSESVLYSLKVRVDIYIVSFRPHLKQNTVELFVLQKKMSRNAISFKHWILL